MVGKLSQISSLIRIGEGGRRIKFRRFQFCNSFGRFHRSPRKHVTQKIVPEGGRSGRGFSRIMQIPANRWKSATNPGISQLNLALQQHYRCEVNSSSTKLLFIRFRSGYRDFEILISKTDFYYFEFGFQFLHDPF